MADIQAIARTVRELFRETFSLGAYQREYEWSEEHVRALLRDLFSAYKPRAGAVGAKGYFLGPMITMGRRNRLLLIDGQQRLTSLALLAIALKRRAARRGAALLNAFDSRMRQNAFSQLFDEPHRQRAFNELETTGAIAAAQNDLERAMAARYAEIEDWLESRIEDDATASALLDWLLDKVSIAEVRADESHDPFALFDAMNSRGKPLDGLAQFTSYLFRKFGDRQELRAGAMANFAEMRESIALQGPGAETDFLLSWASARCIELNDSTPARATEARKKLSRSIVSEIESKGPFFLMEQAEARPELGLSDPYQFIEQHWCVFGEAFDAVRQARHSFDPNLPGMYFLEQVGFDLELYDEIIMLAAVKPGANADVNTQRLQIALQFMENIAARWAWTDGGKGITARSPDRMKYLLAHAASKIRGASNHDMARTLALAQRQIGFDFDDHTPVHPSRGASPKLHGLLARIGGYLDTLDGKPDGYGEYARRNSGEDRYEVEHLLPARASSPSQETGHRFRRPEDYRKNRQRIGALVLLRHDQNNWLRDKLYPQKYSNLAANGNLLCKALHGSSALPPAAQRALNQLGVSFSPAPMLDKATLLQREAALLKLAQAIWSEERILALTSNEVARAA